MKVMSTATNLKIRKSGFYKDEEEELLRFCLSDDYPRSITIERTGTTYKLSHPSAARMLWRKIRGINTFGTKWHSYENICQHDDDSRILFANNLASFNPFSEKRFWK